MYSKLLIPLDGSRLAESILPYARRLARLLELPVELLFIDDANEPAPCIPFMAQEYLQRIAGSFAAPVAVQHRFEIGSAGSWIVDVAGTKRDALIVMATHGYSGVKRWLLGSVAEKVLRASTSPLLLLRPSTEQRDGEAALTSVVVPLDGSVVAESVLPTVTHLARKLALPVTLLRVVRRVYAAPPEAVLPMFGVHPDLGRLWEEARAEAQVYLDGKAAELRAGGLPQVTAQVVEGGSEGAAAAILDFTKDTPNHLIVMCTRGESGIGRWLIGSVTERVAYNSHTAVLVLHPPA